MEPCPNREANIQQCTCAYDCSRKGLCCECVVYHREKGQLPQCYQGYRLVKG